MPREASQFKPKPEGEALAASPICAKFDRETDAFLRAHPDRSGFIRAAVAAAIQETLHLDSIPGMQESILEGMATPLSECSTEPGW